MRGLPSRLTRRLAVIGVAGAAVSALVCGVTPGVATAHDEHGDGSRELFPGEGVADGHKQHDGDTGHLPAVNRNVELVGKAEVTNPSGDGNTRRIADVAAHGNYAYLNAFAGPTCAAGGVHVMNIADPSAPYEVTDAFIPTSPGSYAGEGVQVIRMHNNHFRGDLLIHQNETCDTGQIVDPSLAGGISMWNVTNPRRPHPITLHTGDVSMPDGGTRAAPNTVHSMRAWYNAQTRRTYVVLVDNVEAADVDIMDITDPYHPVMVNDTLDLDELFGVSQPSPDNLTSVFSHDMMIYRIGQRYVMNMNYWDGGYVLLDVTDPRPGRVSAIANTDYAELDEQRLLRGHQIAPEGNAHQSELSRNGKFLLGTDEDFSPFRMFGTVDSGPYAGTEFLATHARSSGPVEEGQPLAGPVTFVGLGCASSGVPAGSGIALVERGECPFQEKLETVAAAGYSVGVVFNSALTGCQSRISMAASGDIPFLFVGRLAGLQLLGVPGVDADNACTTQVPAGTAEQDTTLWAEFDGWGYVRLFATDIPNQRGRTGSITQLDTYSVPEGQDAAMASGFGDLSVHEVAMDPDRNIAYISYYAAGLRVLRFGAGGIQEVGAFVDEGGNNFWGVEVWHNDRGQKYVLASDRDYGLYILRYRP